MKPIPIVVSKLPMESCRKIQAFLLVIMIVGAEVHKIQSDARFIAVSGLQPRDTVSISNAQDNRECELEILVDRSNHTNLLKCITEQMEALIANPNFQKLSKFFCKEVNLPSPNSQETANVMDESYVCDQAEHSDEMLQVMMLDRNLQMLAKSVAEQLEGLGVYPNCQDCGNLSHAKRIVGTIEKVRENFDYQERVKRLADVLNSIMGDPTIDALAAQIHVDRRALEQTSSAYDVTRRLTGSWTTRGKLADELVDDVVDNLFRSALRQESNDSLHTSVGHQRERNRRILFGLISGCLMCAVLFGYLTKAKPDEVTYAAMLSLIGSHAASITDMRISHKFITYSLDGKEKVTSMVHAPKELITLLHEKGVDFAAAPNSVATFLGMLISTALPFLGLAGIYYLMIGQMKGFGNTVAKKASSLRLSKDRFRFEDVAGVDTAKKDVQEIVWMLKNQARYKAAGARLPSGVLMIGPPGSGKTLLARVMAAQADVPFFYCSASDFVELFVGRGAARIRALFKEAEEVAPSIIFVDELDALGQTRSSGIGHAEIEQTLNQMLACMDGLDSSNNGVMVMAATNRYEVLDPALTRPGRFDRVVRVDLPNEQGRVDILSVHTRTLKLSPSVDLHEVAKVTPQYSGAELATVTNEAAIRSVRRSSNVIDQDDFLSAVISFNTTRGGQPSNGAVASGNFTAVLSDLIQSWQREAKQRDS